MRHAEVALDLGGPRGAGSLTYRVPDDMPIRPGDLVLVPLQTRLLPGVVVSVVGDTPSFATRPVEDKVAEDAFVGPLQLTLARWIAAHYRASLYDCLSLFLPPGLAARLTKAARAGRWKTPDAPPIPAEPPVLPTPRPGPPLTLAQQSAARRIVASVEQREARAYLLHGVTGSGKTHVYLDAVARTLELGRQAIVLVPEIALTPSTFSRFDERFPGRVAVLHSQLRPAEHRQSWERVRQGEADVVLGSRSALFAPVRRPGLVILDEEHEPSYRQDSSPRYHAREVALWWGQLARAPVVLGSATPDVETYYRTERGRYTLLSLEQRFIVQESGVRACPERSEGSQETGEAQGIVQTGARPGLTLTPTLSQRERELSPPPLHRNDAGRPEGRGPVFVKEGVGGGASRPDEGVGGWGLPGTGDRGANASRLPPVAVVDMRAELRAGNTSIFSRELDEALAGVLKRGEQALLFLNRRGSATCVSCRDCGHVVCCRRCDVPLVYHRAGEALVCHRCNRRSSAPERCPECGGGRIRYLGLGTQRVEHDLADRFPAARIVRWDHDSTKQRGTYDALWRAFSAGEADVMIGTQMIAKALDFPRVTLVGVVLADVGLFLPDFRAGERIFQLLSQMAGRGGRGTLSGRAIVQTYVPDHYAIQAAAGHDYQGFYEREMAFRRVHGYPPVGRLVRLVYSTSKEEKCAQETRRVRALLDAEIARQGIADIQVIGPAPCFAHRLRGRGRWALLLRGDRFARLLDRLELPPGWTIDVDPTSLL